MQNAMQKSFAMQSKNVLKCNLKKALKVKNSSETDPEINDKIPNYIRERTIFEENECPKSIRGRTP